MSRNGRHKRHNRRGVVLAAAGVMSLVVATAAVAAVTSFDDVPDDHLFALEIAWMDENDITRGCNPPDNTLFCPSDFVTRGQMSAFLYRFAHSEALAGLAGPQGPPGPIGPQGDPGLAGADGDSAYDLAVEEGFEGTPEEWLASLQGEQGIQGIQGEPGADGVVTADMILVETNSLGPNTTDIKSLSAECPEGYIVIGGGVHSTGGGNDIYVLSSHPGDANDWFGAARELGILINPNWALHVYAMCLAVVEE